MRAPLRLPALALALAASLATGCAAEVAANDRADAPTETRAPVASLADGEHFGHLVAVTTDPATVTIDPATWVTDDAEPNGYRIEDPGLDPVDLPLASHAEIEVLRSTGDPTTAETVTIEELQAWFADLGQPDETAQFDLVVEDGQVVGMGFVYRP